MIHLVAASAAVVVAVVAADVVVGVVLVALLCCVCVVVDIAVVLSEVSGYVFEAVDVLFDIVGVFIFVFVVFF